MQFSSFYITGTATPNVVALSSTCKMNVTGALITLDDLARTPDASIIMPSMCDGKFN